MRTNSVLAVKFSPLMRAWTFLFSRSWNLLKVTSGVTTPSKRCCFPCLTRGAALDVRTPSILQTEGCPERVIGRPFNRSRTFTGNANCSLVSTKDPKQSLQMSAAQGKTISNCINSRLTSLRRNCSKVSLKENER